MPEEQCDMDDELSESASWLMPLVSLLASLDDPLLRFLLGGAEALCLVALRFPL